MMRFLKSLLTRRPVRVTIIRRDPCRLTLEEWRSEQALVASAKAQLANPELRAMLDVLTTASPANHVYTLELPLDVRAVLHARGEGYAMALANLESLAIWEQPEKPIEETFEPPDKTEETETQ